MSRKKSHFQDKEPLLENFLSNLRFRQINKHIPKNAVLVDLGCGYYGKHICKISDKIKSGIGLDIAVSNKKPAKNITLIKARVDKKIPLDSNSCDVVTSLAVIEHLEDPATHLLEARRILKPGGTLLITTPSKKAKPVIEFLSFKLKLISSEEITDHKRYYNLASLKKILIKTGFEPNNIDLKHFQLGMNIYSKSKK